MPVDNDTLHFTLGKIEGRLDQLIMQLSVKDEREAKTYSDINSRIAKVEAKQYWLSGVAASVSAIAAWLFGQHGG